MTNKAYFILLSFFIFTIFFSAKNIYASNDTEADNEQLTLASAEIKKIAPPRSLLSTAFIGLGVPAAATGAAGALFGGAVLSSLIVNDSVARGFLGGSAIVGIGGNITGSYISTLTIGRKKRVGYLISRAIVAGIGGYYYFEKDQSIKGAFGVITLLNLAETIHNVIDVSQQWDDYTNANVAVRKVQSMRPEKQSYAAFITRLDIRAAELAEARRSSVVWIPTMRIEPASRVKASGTTIKIGISTLF